MSRGGGAERSVGAEQIAFLGRVVVGRFVAIDMGGVALAVAVFAVQMLEAVDVGAHRPGDQQKGENQQRGAAVHETGPLTSPAPRPPAGTAGP